VHRTLAMIAVFLVGSLSVGLSARVNGDDSDALMANLFQRAKAHDREGLVALESRVAESQSSALRHAYRLARYIADPEGYAAQYVLDFPEDSAGVMGAVYSVELARGPDGQPLVPQFLYSFTVLGKLAERGEPGAARKIFIVAVHSDGVVTDAVCEKAVKLLVDQPAQSVATLASLQESERQKVYGCFFATPRDDLEAVRNAVVALPAEKYEPISKEILEALR